MKKLQHKIISTVERHKITLSGKDIRELIKAQTSAFNIPTDADICVYIPGGGDWSNTTLDIDEDHPIVIEWKTEIVEEK